MTYRVFLVAVFVTCRIAASAASTKVGRMAQVLTVPFWMATSVWPVFMVCTITVPGREDNHSWNCSSIVDPLEITNKEAFCHGLLIRTSEAVSNRL